MNDTLQCPSCNYSAAASEFVPPKMVSQFAERAGALLIIIVTLSLLRGFGFLKVWIEDE